MNPIEQMAKALLEIQTITFGIPETNCANSSCIEADQALTDIDRITRDTLTSYAEFQKTHVSVRRDRLDEALCILESGCPEQECPNEDDSDGSIDCKACWKAYFTEQEE